MNIVPKAQLVDGAYYEGMTVDYNVARVAMWNSKENQFEYVMHHWQDKFLVPMTYWDEDSEYFEQFQPLQLVEARDFEKVDGLQG